MESYFDFYCTDKQIIIEDDIIQHHHEKPDQRMDQNSQHLDQPVTKVYQPVQTVIRPVKKVILSEQKAGHPLEKADHEVKNGKEAVNMTITMQVGSKTKTQSTKLNEEQRRLLDEVQMPTVKSILDDWVLVDFTPKEVARFAELMRYKPGWLEDSIEIQKCCKVM